MNLSKSQLKALRTYMAERDVATQGIRETLAEAGLDPDGNYNVDFQTGAVTPFQPPTVEQVVEEAGGEIAGPIELDKSE